MRDAPLLDLVDHFVGCQMASVSWRKMAHSRFQKIGLPTQKEGSFQYLPLSRLSEEGRFAPAEDGAISKGELSAFCLPECRGQYLVMVNGRLRLDLSAIEGFPSSVVILPLPQALGLKSKRSPYAPFLSGRLTRQIKEEKDPFALLNSSLFDEGLFLYIPPKTRLDRPIHLLHFTRGKKKMVLTPRVQLFVGAGAKVDLISQTVGSGGHLITEVLDVASEEGATIAHTQLPCPPAEAWFFSSLQGTLARQSSYEMLFYTRGAKTVRQKCQFSLLGEEARVEFKGLASLEGANQGHLCTLVSHEAPHTRSHQLYKQLLEGNSRGSFEGKIFVDRLAQKTEGYQLCKSLLLGEHAQANSKPNLEIFADDVKASHGATVFQLDAQQLLYLKTRGLSEEESRQLLIEGFTHEILSLIPPYLLSQR